ncbi:hypothetical protein VW35_02205 [Devosia soli]|uniref:Uncharacterized protein n=1 Tax=Devosia soli TaxID=361041 RepID=A0A0F5LFB4_9HYPH|nr:hypothetical protein VW35_02205 [Devosia soli]
MFNLIGQAEIYTVTSPYDGKSLKELLAEYRASEKTGLDRFTVKGISDEFRQALITAYFNEKPSKFVDSYIDANAPGPVLINHLEAFLAGER